MTALLLSMTVPAAHAACNSVTVANVSTSFQFNTSGDKTLGSITEASGNISATCSGGSSGYLFVNSNNNSSNTTGQGIATLSTDATQSINYRVRQVVSSSKTAWGNTTGSSGNFMEIATSGSPYSYYIDSATTPDSSFPAPGLYQDTLAISNANNQNNTGNPTTLSPVTISVDVPTQCFLPATLGTLTLNYTPGQAVTPATLSFDVSCNVPYTISLNASTGTLLGVNYTLSLSNAGNNARGKGRSHAITANIPDTTQLGACPQNGSCNPATASSPPSGAGQHYVQVAP